MTIRELSDEDLSRWIVEKLGWTVVDLPFIARDVKLGPNVYFTEEAGRQWRYQYPAGTYIRLVPDMANNPAMTLMLLKQMAPIGYTLIVAADLVLIYLRETRRQLGRTEDIEQLGRAVAEAFALANGWQG